VHRDESYTDRAAIAVVEAVREEHDFGGWLAGVLARAAAELGSTAALVEQLVRGTVGSEDEHLSDYRGATTANVE